eukprot:CAMPEP_0206125354 /NCGR_PEP_ID=MMETSP1472-20131121/16746_1 /ASSEMBLY_ACC=CAM_ASM_001108 /TAXON_ID=41880 /ORGANISM="Pycnococcus provasolii, Strain RCC251" /LENGTH=103 /DNA_ID=CAMNT_0053516245 /DNA_START=231 /DNA_END=542 /DNA_ORIENTATION=+
MRAWLPTLVKRSTRQDAGEPVRSAARIVFDLASATPKPAASGMPRWLLARMFDGAKLATKASRIFAWWDPHAAARGCTHRSVWYAAPAVQRNSSEHRAPCRPK